MTTPRSHTKQEPLDLRVAYFVAWLHGRHAFETNKYRKAEQDVILAEIESRGLIPKRKATPPSTPATGDSQ
jgi:hypothetical protein